MIQTLRVRARIPVLMSLCLALFFSVVACSTDEKKSETPEGLFAIAQEFEEGERYELAIQRYTEVKNKFPYSAYALRAELAVADVHYKQEAWPEAQVSYQTFRELHPTHAKIDYVIFRIGLTFYNQLPETVDRDLSLAQDAIAHFDEVATRYPRSEYAGEARDKKAETLKKLAGKEAYIADFYFKRQLYDSALPRYEGLLQRYPNLGFDEVALAKAAISAAKTDQMPKAKRFLNVLKQRFPDSPELSAATREVEK